MSKYRYIVVLFALWAVLTDARAQTDSLYIDSTTIISHKNTSVIRDASAGVLSVDMEDIQDYPKIMGNSDPLNFVKFLSGVQTTSEYDSGIHIHGCDNAHNEILLGGVPVYGATHLFGLFSVFNPSHYSEMKFAHNISSSSGSNRLGGSIYMELPDSLKHHDVKGDIAVGIMSAQGTVSFKAGKNSYMHISARQSFLNFLYKRWLKVDGNPMRYGFGDYNLTCFIKAGRKDRLWLDVYFGKDQAYIGAGHYNIDVGAEWGNLTSALHWEHMGKGYTMNHTAYASCYSTDVFLKQIDASLNGLSSIATVGYKAKIRWGRGFVSGADMTLYRVLPQYPEVRRNDNAASDDREVQTGAEADIYTDYSRNITDEITLNAGLKGSIYISPEKESFWDLSPLLSISYDVYRWGKLRAMYAFQHQYLFQTGLSNIGLPMDFWLMAGKHSAPQSAHSFTLGYEVKAKGEMYRLSCDLYYKSLRNQIEYNGDLFDLINSDYDLDRYLMKGDGMNYGINLMIHKQAGRMTGWLSYSLGRALRTFDDPAYPGIYPSNHERIHEFNALCSYKMDKWQFSGTFVCASGTPFTAPEAFYISSGNLITKFGEYNSARLRPYIRLDLSVNRSFRKDERQENGINISVYNVLARKNEVMWRLQTKDNEFSYKSLAFFLRVMPSISYYHKF